MSENVTPGLLLAQANSPCFGNSERASSNKQDISHHKHQKTVLDTSLKVKPVFTSTSWAGRFDIYYL